MATYVVGDVQGCYRSLRALLDQTSFGAGDKLWLVGDLVNRGPASLEVLRWVRGLDARTTVVLGNHDVHLISRAAGVSSAKRRDTLDDVLAAPDGAALIEWLRRRPLVHRDGGWLMVHAGLLPIWSADDAEREARACERALAAPSFAEWLRDREATRALQVFIRLRMLDASGAPADYDGSQAKPPRGLSPWFSAPARRSRDVTVLFGHWSQLGFHRGTHEIGLDTGCVWGGALTALRLEDGAIFTQPALEPPAELGQ